MLKTSIVLFCALLGASPGAPAPDPARPASSPVGSMVRADTLADLAKEIEDAAKASPLQEEQALAFAKRAEELAKGAKDAATRIGALEQALKIPLRKKSEELTKVRDGLWDLVVEKDADEGVLLAPLVNRGLREEAREKLRKKTKAPELKATFALMDLSAQINKRDRSEKETEELVLAIEKLKKEHGKTLDPARKQTFAETCDGLLFPIQKLAIGKEVPDIEGKDTSGVAFKLSDYRGKVVLLDFWGHW